MDGPESASEIVLGSSAPKAVLARVYGISRETVCQYLRNGKARVKSLPCRHGRMRGLSGDYWYPCIFDTELLEPSDKLKVVVNGLHSTSRRKFGEAVVVGQRIGTCA